MKRACFSINLEKAGSALIASGSFAQYHLQLYDIYARLLFTFGAK